MKKIWILILALALAGCSSQKTPEPSAVPETAAATEAVTQPPETTLPPEPAYPETMEVEIPGEKEPVTMELFDGGNYVIYIPRDQWTRETEAGDGHLTDCWSDARSGKVSLSVVQYGDMTEEAVEKLILVTETGFRFSEPEGDWHGGLDTVYGRRMDFAVRTDGSSSFALKMIYPLGYEKSCGPTLEAMADSFLIK